MFPVLDPLRAVGALAVVTTHATFWTGDYLRHGVFGPCWPGWTSGWRSSSCCPASCCPTTTWPGADRGRPSRTGRYFWKRFLRIYPAYLVGVVLAMVFVEGNADAGLATGPGCC